MDALASVVDNPRYHFEQGDIADATTLSNIFQRYQPDCVMHLAAESHVDRSIAGAAAFIQTNIVGTYTLLEVTRQYWLTLDEKAKRLFVFTMFQQMRYLVTLTSHNLRLQKLPLSSK